MTIAAVFVALGAPGAEAVETPVTNLAVVVALSDADFAAHRPFDLTGELVHFGSCLPEPGMKTPRYSIWLRDAERILLVHGPLPSGVRTGDVLRVAGRTSFDPTQFRLCLASNTSIADATIPPPRAVDTSGHALLDGDACNQRIVRVEGLVDEVFTDEVDPQFVHFVINAGGAEIHATTARGDAKALGEMVGATVRLTGAFLPHPATSRRFMGPILRVFSRTDIVVTKEAAIDLLGLPECPSPYSASPQAIAAWGRRRMTGEVLAAWQGNQILLRTDDGEVHRAELVRGHAAPTVGRRVICCSSLTRVPNPSHIRALKASPPRKNRSAVPSADQAGPPPACAARCSPRAQASSIAWPLRRWRTPCAGRSRGSRRRSSRSGDTSDRWRQHRPRGRPSSRSSGSPWADPTS